MSSAAFPRAGLHSGAGSRLQGWPPPAAGLTREQPIGRGPTLVLRAQPPEYSCENVFLSLPSMRGSRSSNTILSYFCDHSLPPSARQCSVHAACRSGGLHCRFTPPPPPRPWVSPCQPLSSSRPELSCGAGGRPQPTPPRSRGWRWRAAAASWGQGGWEAAHGLTTPREAASPMPCLHFQHLKTAQCIQSAQI